MTTELNMRHLPKIPIQHFKNLLLHNFLNLLHHQAFKQWKMLGEGFNSWVHEHHEHNCHAICHAWEFSQPGPPWVPINTLGLQSAALLQLPELNVKMPCYPVWETMGRCKQQHPAQPGKSTWASPGMHQSPSNAVHKAEEPASNQYLSHSGNYDQMGLLLQQNLCFKNGLYF